MEFLTPEFLKDLLAAVSNVWSFLLVVLFFAAIATKFIYKKDPEIFNKIVDKIGGKKNDENFEKLFDIVQKKTNEQQSEIEEIKEQVRITSINNTTNFDKYEKQSELLEHAMRDISKISLYIDKQNKTQMFDNKIREIISKQIEDKGINHKEFITLLYAGAREGIDFFNEMKEVGLKKYDVLNLQNEMISRFKKIRANITPANIDNYKQVNINIRDKVVLPQIAVFVRIFENKQSALYNGELLKEFELICINFVKQITIQSYNELKRLN